jgi:alanine-glyoxylate transaminase/serine-glyoxylate transaminase/serine-pyruvate transaminase
MPDMKTATLPTTSNPRIPGRRFLHAPGPTPVPDEVLQAMSNQPMDLSDPRVNQIIASCEAGLKRLLHTANADVYMYAANGHGVWEAAIANLLAPGQRGADSGHRALFRVVGDPVGTGSASR